VFRASPTFIIKFVFITGFECIHINSKDAIVTSATFNAVKNTYELFFFMSYDLLRKIEFSKKRFVDCLGSNITFESLDGTIFFKKIYVNYFEGIEKCFKKSVKRLYIYIKKHQLIEGLPDMSDILKRCDELDDTQYK
ncbi:hypothetical protein THOM_1965, partial [Trachipleistophora hominis]